MIGVWCSPDEFEFIGKAAKSQGLSKGNYCRQVVLGNLPQAGITDGPVSRKEFKELHRELSAIGNNLNQLTRKANTTGALQHQKLFENIRDDLSQIGNRLLEELI